MINSDLLPGGFFGKLGLAHFNRRRVVFILREICRQLLDALLRGRLLALLVALYEGEQLLLLPQLFRQFLLLLLIQGNFCIKCWVKSSRHIAINLWLHHQILIEIILFQLRLPSKDLCLRLLPLLLSPVL